MGTVLTGKETYQEIVRLKPNQKVIITSGYSESDDIKETINLGASGFIKKTYSTDKLGLLVKEALN